MDRLTELDNLINKKYLDLDAYAESEKKNYINSIPFPNIIIKDFFDENFLTAALNEFPDLSIINNSEIYKNKNEVKFANNNYEDFPKKIKILFDFLNSEIFLKFLQKISSIKETLITDPGLNGGGLHEIKRGGLLKVHTDFNRHPNLNLDRRLNVLIYLNKTWQEDFGGHLQLWDKDMKACQKKITPLFNTMVIFSTTDFSNHGHPDPLNCPDGLSRKSFATYYFSKGRPNDEITNRNLKNTTNFKDRYGYFNETIHKQEKLKNYFRSFSFYKYLKNIEKKIFRTGRSKKKRDKTNSDETN